MCAVSHTSHVGLRFGSVPALLAKKGVAPDNTRRSYLKFDVSHISDGDQVALRLQEHASNGTGLVNMTVYVG